MSAKKYEGAEWLRSVLRQDLSPLAAAVADVLGQTYLGIYHLPRSNWEPARWSDPFFVWAVVPGGLASFDSCYLTALLVHSHDRCLRVEISPAGPHYLRLKFHQRTCREGRMSQRLPSLDEHISIIRQASGLGELP